MASSSWHRLGEGFVSDNNTSASTSNSNTVVGKSSQLPWRKCATKKWKQNQFLSSFGSPVEKESTPEQIDDISWSASSSDEDNKNVRKNAEQIKCLELKRSRIGKRRSINVKKRSAVDSCLSQASKSLKHESSFDSFTKNARDAIKKDAMDDSVSTELFMMKEYKKPVDKPSSTWDYSTFEDIKKSDTYHHTPKKNRKISCEGSSYSTREPETVNIVVCESSSESEDVNEKVDEDSDDENTPEDLRNSTPKVTCVSKANSILQDPFLPQNKDSDQEIEICSLSSPSVVSVSTSQKVGASDWANAFRQEVSHPHSNDGEGKDCLPPNQHDSTKKKQKYSSNSLVGQLSRLIKREKSSTRFWQHSVSKEFMSIENSKSVTLRVISMSRQFSFCVAQCKILDDKDSLLNCKACKMMFVKSVLEKMDVQPGSLLQLFPPWKQLDEGDKTTILCANQVQVVCKTEDAINAEWDASDYSKESSVKARPLLTDDCVEEKIEISFKWACPCKENPLLPSNQCPVNQSDHFDNLFSQMSLLQNAPSSNHSIHFHSVQSSGLSVSQHPLPSVAPGSLIQSIQEERAGRDCMPPFTATVLRVFRQKILTRNSICLSVLLEDASGMLALVQQQEMDVASHKSTWLKLVQMEGKECLCKAMTMVTRRTKDRDPSLFQVIAHVWKSGILQVDSQDSLQLSQKSRKIPSFCYILQPVDGFNSWLNLLDKKESQKTDELELESLRQSVEVSCGQRFSCLAKVIDVQYCLPESSETRNLFVCEPREEDEKSNSNTVFYPLVVDRRCVRMEKCTDRKLYTYLLQDVFFDGHAVLADEYSSLLPWSLWHELGLDKSINSSLCDSMTRHEVNVPYLGHASSSDRFVKVSGPIVNINADKCYEWTGCGGCGQELTVADASGVLQCLTCDNELPNYSRMNMEVEILEETCKGCVVKIELSQSSISHLLPQEIPDEGYDMDQVLGKLVHAIAYVIDRTDGTIRLSQIDV